MNLERWLKGGRKKEGGREKVRGREGGRKERERERNN